MQVLAPTATARKPEPSNTTADHFSPRRRCRSKPLDGPLFDARFRRHVDHLCRLGARPIGELLLQLAGNHDDGRTALIVLLEQYQRLDADVVAALGGDRWPENIFPVGPT